MKKILSLLLITFLVLPFQPVFAANQADPDDNLTIISPKPNEKVSGNVTIEWQSSDDDQTSIPYYIQLFDGATCRTTSFGRVSTNANAISSSSQNNKITWNSSQTLSNSNLSDGAYCLQLCFAFKTGDSYYSVCNARIINIVNVNKLPSISSVPTILTINENENWEYQLKATDADNDTLKYYLLYAPEFLEINPATGLIKTKPNISRLSDEVNIAEYRVVAGVEDQISGTTSQEFTLRIERGRQPNTTTPETPAEPDTKPQEPTNSPSQISFKTPKENEEFSGLQNFIEWSVYDPEGVKEITLSYSKNLETWTEIITRAEQDFSKYSWDVSEIEDGKYFVQIKVKDNKDEVVAKTSKAFFIKNESEPDIAKNPLIINVKPENTNELTESPAAVIGDFAASSDEEIDVTTFAIQLNSQDLSNQCNVTAANFVCNLTEKLSEGEYKINIEIKDKLGNIGTYESVFSIRAADVTDQTPSSESSENNLSIIGIVIVVVIFLLLLLAVPWILLGASKQKRRSQSESKTVITPAAPPPAPVMPPLPALPVLPPVQQTAQPETTQFILPSQPSEPTAVPALTPAEPQVQNANMPADFSEFMQSYNFNTQPQPQLGNIKPKPEPKTSITDTFKNVAQKVTTFKPQAAVNEGSVTGQAQPVLPAPASQNLSQNIEMAYSGGVSGREPEQPTAPTQTQDQTYTEPVIADSQLVEPQVADNSEDELRKMYPELYGASTQAQDSGDQNSINTANPANTSNDEFFEPKPKD